MRLGTELIVATFVGALMGYTLDKFLGTKPWFLVAGVIFGGAAGSLNVYRLAQSLQEDENRCDNDKED